MSSCFIRCSNILLYTSFFLSFLFFLLARSHAIITPGSANLEFLKKKKTKTKKQTKKNKNKKKKQEKKNKKKILAVF